MLNLPTFMAAPAQARQFPNHIAIVALLTIVLGACSAPELPGLYRIDIQQGNVVTREMLIQLEPGMDKRRVQFVLGTPLVADTFNDNRWDYIYTYKTGSDNRMQRNIAVFFEDERLARLEGDVERAVLSPQAPERPDTIVKVKGPRRARGFLASLNPFSGTPKPGEDVIESDKQLPKDADAQPTDSNRRIGLLEPTHDDDRREPQQLAPMTTVNGNSDRAVSDAQGRGRQTSEQVSSTRPDSPEPSVAEPSTTSPSDEPSWWERVKQGVGISDDKSEDNSAPIAAATNEKETRREGLAEPDPVKQIETSFPTEEPAAQPAVAATPPESVEASAEGDGGFFDLIRNRFKLPELPEFLSLPTAGAPEDFNPNTGDP